MPVIKIDQYSIGAGQPCFIIAEAGVNHDGDIAVAKELVEVSRAIGADAIKFQTFRASEIASATAPKAQYQLQHTRVDESQLEMLRKLELDEGQFSEIAQHCRKNGIMFLSTPFDMLSVRTLATLDVPAFKIASGEITNPDLLVYIARQGRPVIMSTGMARLDEVRRALELMKSNGCRDIALLHCVSSYPADPRDVNLRAMRTMADEFDCVVGFSDHTEGVEVSIAAVACGAAIVEKHITLDRDRAGPDHRASLEPDTFAAMIRGIRIVESALGNGLKEPAPCELEIAAVARRSLIANGDIPAGSKIDAAMLAVRRPGTGLSPFSRDTIEGRRARVDIADGTPITADLVE